MPYSARATTSGTAPALAFSKSFAADTDDPVLGAFLRFLEQSMRDHPELLRPLTASDIAGMGELIEGIDADLDANIGDDGYVLP